MKAGLVYDVRFLAHRAPYAHPEHPGRLEAIWQGLNERGLVERFERVPTRAASSEELLAVHTERLIRQVEETAGREVTELDPDTYANRHSAEAAKLAAGGLVDLTLGVVRGELARGLALLRPPGHHAEAEAAMGFCLFNNVAVAARAASRAGARKILIVDWDVHHGNGTQSAFWDDPDVLYFSIHQFPFYPGTGSIRETGGEGARGRTVNVPWPAGMGDAEYLAVFSRVLVPIAREFGPDLVLVSCGFDAAAGDLLGGMRVTPDGYARMTAGLLPLARGRVVLALEGGYALDAISRSAAACAEVLLANGAEDSGLRTSDFELVPAPHSEPAAAGLLASRVLDEVVRVQRPFWPALSS